MRDIKRNFSKYNFLVITHSFATGPPQELRDYLKNKVNKLLFIKHPFSYCGDKRSAMVLYERGIKKKKVSFLQLKGPDFLFYLKDFILTIAYAFMAKTKFDVAIAADNLNAFSALFLRKLGRVKKVIFFTIDYTPVRFQNKVLNAIYHWIDRVCCYNADLVWNDSGFMENERVKKGVNAQRSAPRVIVPGGNHFSRIKRFPINEINRHEIVYMGHVLRKQGLDLAIESLPELVNKIHDLKFTVIGTGDYLEELKRKVAEMNLVEYVNFVGYIEDFSDLEKILAKCTVGVATYFPDPASATLFSDSGKPRIYMACGLPIVMTKFATVAADVAANETGMVIDYKKKEFIAAVLKLLTDDELYGKYRKNAIEFASGFDWERIFDNALSESLKRLNMANG